MEKNSIKVAYETESYVFVNEKIKLFVDENVEQWTSSNEEVATVNNGVVTGLSEGTCLIRCYLNNNEYFCFNITVLAKEQDDIIYDLLKAHNSNIFVKKDFRIGYVKDGYDTDIIESVSKILLNEPLIINDEYLEAGNEKWEISEFREYLRSIEFITVHYTCNFRPGANALAHAKYFNDKGQNTSIHYTTGNDGVYLNWDNKKRAAHAGDSAGPEFEWINSGVKYDGCALDKVNVTVSNDFYYVINGVKSTIHLPSPYKYKDRNTNHIYLDNGFIQIENTDILKKPEEMFNDMGFAFIVKDGIYHMSTTWWCYTQTLDGRICNVGGNRNSIGIESCVDIGSDLWYTWQKTAQLVAKLMLDNNLDINRVKGHHFFSAKYCPQPMIVNNYEIWKKFIDMVKLEYLFLTKYNNYDISMKILSGSNVKNNGRIENVTTQNIVYELNIYNKETKKDQKVVLSSIVCA